MKVPRAYIHKHVLKPIQVKVRGSKIRFYGALDRTNELIHTESGTIEFHNKKQLNEFLNTNKYKVLDVNDCPKESFTFLNDIIKKQQKPYVGGRSLIKTPIMCDHCCSLYIEGLCRNCGKGGFNTYLSPNSTVL